MDVPGFRLHALKSDLQGFWAVTVRANWRVIFRFDGRDACDVESTTSSVMVTRKEGSRIATAEGHVRGEGLRTP